MDNSHDKPNILISVFEAKMRLLENFSATETENIPVSSAVGRILATDVHTEIELPSFNNSAMDGFAIISEDSNTANLQNPAVFTVIADLPAGRTTSVSVENGQAIRIMTGAPIPAGADAVVPVEDTDFNYRQPGMAAPKKVSIFQPAQKGQNIRFAGEDVSNGELALDKNHKLRPQDVGFLSMLGVTEIKVFKKPKVAVFSTGDELLSPGDILTPGKIFDANTNMILALVEKYGGRAINLGIVPDKEGEVKSCLEKATSNSADLIISTAGVSVGAFDFVRSVVEDHGVLDFWRVNMRPGKPIAIGQFQDTPFVGLPGNPVSAYVGFMVFVRPVLLKLQGLVEQNVHYRQARIAEELHSDGRESYLRAIVSRQNGELVVRLTGHQGSGNLLSLVQANAFLLIPQGVQNVPQGSLVDVWLFDDI